MEGALNTQVERTGKDWRGESGGVRFPLETVSADPSAATVACHSAHCPSDPPFQKDFQTSAKIERNAGLEVAPAEGGGGGEAQPLTSPTQMAGTPLLAGLLPAVAFSTLRATPKLHYDTQHI